MYKVMFVCHGNICRSPMAEFILKHMLEKAGLSHKVTVASSATSTEEIFNGVGNPIYPPAARELSLRGIPFSPRRAVQLQSSDGEKYDIFVAMDSANLRNMQTILGSSQKEKTVKLMSFAHKSSDVADPWYTGGFDVAFDDIYEGCRGLLEHIKKNV